MKKYSIKVKSTTPLLINVRDRKVELELKEVKKNELEEWEQNNWKRKAELDEKGNVILPSRWFRSSFIQGCRSSKVIPHFASRKNETYTKYAESMIFQSGTFKCKPKDLKEFGAYVGAQGKNSSTKIWRIRPQIDKWETEFIIVDALDRITIKELNEIFDFSGMLIGVGDGRNLNYGRFEIVKIKEL
jgi:hypothetical protein